MKNYLISEDEKKLLESTLVDFEDCECVLKMMQDKKPMQVLDREKVLDILYDFFDRGARKKCADKILQLIPQQKPTENEIREIVNKWIIIIANRPLTSADIESLISQLSNLYKGDKK